MSEPSKFEMKAAALLNTEELLHAYREGDPEAMTAALITCLAQPQRALMALVVWADQAVKDAAEQRGVSEELYLRGLAAAVLSVYASSKEDA